MSQGASSKQTQRRQAKGEETSRGRFGHSIGLTDIEEGYSELAVHPVYAPMRNFAGFRALERRMGLDR